MKTTLTLFLILGCAAFYVNAASLSKISDRLHFYYEYLISYIFSKTRAVFKSLSMDNKLLHNSFWSNSLPWLPNTQTIKLSRTLFNLSKI